METSTWRKASASANEGQCVEVYGTLRAIRDSKNVDGPELRGIDVAALVACIKHADRS